MSNQINIVSFINFKANVNGESQPWRNGLAFESLDALVRRAKANKEVDSLFVLEAEAHYGGKDENGNAVPFYKSTGKVAYKGYRKSGGVWWAEINPYKVGIDKVAIPQEVAKPEEVNPNDYLTILGHFGSDAIARCHKSAKPFVWGKLYRHTHGTGWVEVPSKEMPSVMKGIAPIAKPEVKSDDLAIQIAEDLVAETPRKSAAYKHGDVTGMKYGRKTVYSDGQGGWLIKQGKGWSVVSMEEIMAASK